MGEIKLPDAYLSAVGARIREAAASAGLSNSELARRCRVTPGAVTQWLNGSVLPATAHLVALWHATGVSADYLLGLTPQLRMEIALLNRPDCPESP